MRSRFIRRGLAGLFLLTLWPQWSAATDLLAVQVELRARQVAPGEPVRIVVHAPAPLAELSGSFRGEPVSFSSDSSSGGQRVWIGWSLVPLDAPPGIEIVEVRGRGLEGAEAVGTRAVTVEAKPFPEEQLKVAPRFVEPPPETAERLDRERAKLAAIYRSRDRPRDVGIPFSRPVPGEPTSVFGTRRLYNGKPRSPHPGLDLRAATGTGVHSSGPGVVVLAEELYYSGNTVIVDHGGGLFTLYAHLSRIDVSPDHAVESGELLGLSGATGRVTGPHLHWGAKIGSRPFDPTALLDERLW